MEDLSPIYRDPLFGIATLIAIIAFVILTDYYRNYYRKKKKEKSLHALVKSYEHKGFFDGIAEFLTVSKDPIPTLLFLAKGYMRSGESEQAIKIYLTLTKQVQDPSLKLETLEGLGETYFQTGFLQKSKDIFLEILANNPRNIRALIKIIEIYETLGEYQSALEAAECIEENLGYPTYAPNPKIALIRAYLNVKILIQHPNQEQKNEKLLEILEEQKELQKMILTHFKTDAPRLFWECLPQQGWENYIDLLWDFPLDQIPQKLITHSPIIEVFQAKGYYPSKTSCSHFSLETLRLFNSYSSQKATLTFSYHCKECLNEFPFDSFRCPNCSELGMMKLISKPQKVQDEKNFSLL